MSLRGQGEEKRMPKGCVSTRGQQKPAPGTTGLGRPGWPKRNRRTRRHTEVTVLGREVRWDEMVQAQHDFVRASFERISELSRRYVEIGQAVAAANARHCRR